MEHKLSELTYKVVAITEIEPFDTNECIDWAIEMMELGYETPNLLMLASFSKPTSYFEIINYVENTVKELGLEMKNRDDAILSYASYYVHKIVKKEKIREKLADLYKFCLERDFEDLVYDFYLLYWAWDQFDSEDSELNHYWKGARKDNIEQIVITEATKWIAAYNERYLQQPK